MSQTRSESHYSFRAPTLGDAEELVALFSRAYPRQDSPPNAGSLSHWRWKFFGGPLPCESTVAIDEKTGQIVGHIGGLPYQTLHRGEQRRAIQTVDHMIDPLHRQGLQRVGLFARLMNTWIDRYCNARQNFAGWGFPSAQDFRIGRKFCGYSLLRALNVLVRSEPPPFENVQTGVEARLVDRFSADGDQLWQQCRPQYSIVGERTSAYLNWRYAEHPEARYSLIEAHDRDQNLRGIAVTRRGGLANDLVTIMDWVVPDDDRDAIRCLLEAGQQRASEAQLTTLIAWFPESQRPFEILQDEGFRVRFTQIIMAGRSFDHGVSVEELRRFYYQTFGDIDYL